MGNSLSDSQRLKQKIMACLAILVLVAYPSEFKTVVNLCTQNFRAVLSRVDEK